MTYHNKYLKFKSKYLDLKKQIGGAIIDIDIKDALILVNFDGNKLQNGLALEYTSNVLKII
jgi:hypothetical protein